MSVQLIATGERAGPYTPHVRVGYAIAADMRKRETLHAVVMHDDGTVAWRGDSSWRDAKRVAGHTVEGDCLKSAQTQALALHRYLVDRGKRWEVEQTAKRVAKVNAERRVRRMKEIEAFLAKVPALRRELRQLKEQTT
jgi:hypothetical protein